MVIRNVNSTSGTRGAWRASVWAGLAIMLILPALAMSLGAEGVDWSGSDFVIMGGLLAVLGLGIEAAVRLVRDRWWRRIALGAVLVLFVLVWAELAVGLFGSPFAGS